MIPYSILLLASLILSSINQSTATCPGRNYAAPYDLSLTDQTLNTVSPVFGSPGYYLKPCGSVDTSLCPYANGMQICFAMVTWELVADGLGDARNSDWSPLDEDWYNGAVSLNTDVSYDYDQCDSTVGVTQISITYRCIDGADRLIVKSEPSISTHDPCHFEFEVDSSIVCAYQSINPRSNKKLSSGWWFVIAMASASIGYLIVGLIFNRLIGGKRGMEMIPNRQFWKELPGLIVDGCSYSYMKIRLLCGVRSSGGLVDSSFESI